MDTVTGKEWCLFWLSAGIGFVLGFIGNLATWKLSESARRRGLEKAYARLEGHYVGYEVKDDQTLDYDRPSSDATIKYAAENRLRIELTPRDSAVSPWDGDISMETPGFGLLAFLERKPDVTKHQFGSKRLMRREGKDRNGNPCIHVYLTGEKDNGYGREVLEKAL